MSNIAPEGVSQIHDDVAVDPYEAHEAEPQSVVVKEWDLSEARFKFPDPVLDATENYIEEAFDEGSFEELLDELESVCDPNPELEQLLQELRTAEYPGQGRLRHLAELVVEDGYGRELAGNAIIIPDGGIDELFDGKSTRIHRVEYGQSTLITIGSEPVASIEDLRSQVVETLSRFGKVPGMYDPRSKTTYLAIGKDHAGGVSSPTKIGYSGAHHIIYKFGLVADALHAAEDRDGVVFVDDFHSYRTHQHMFDLTASDLGITCNAIPAFLDEDALEVLHKLDVRFLDEVVSEAPLSAVLDVYYDLPKTDATSTEAIVGNSFETAKTGGITTPDLHTLYSMHKHGVVLPGILTGYTKTQGEEEGASLLTDRQLQKEAVTQFVDSYDNSTGWPVAVSLASNGEGDFVLIASKDHVDIMRTVEAAGHGLAVVAEYDAFLRVATPDFVVDGHPGSTVFYDSMRAKSLKYDIVVRFGRRDALGNSASLHPDVNECIKACASEANREPGQERRAWDFKNSPPIVFKVSPDYGVPY